MELIELATWSDYRSAIEDVYSKYGKHRFGSYELKNRVLFRGQADASWRLVTTLERFSKRTWSVRDYAQLAHRCGPQVESFTDRSLDLLGWDALAKYCESFDPVEQGPPDYSFWIYLRQHSFPSPLLDWTLSPYIAAFFAASDRTESDKRAVYAYIETPQGTKGGCAGSKAISVLGPYLRAHKRHYLQQSWYTICTQQNEAKYFFTCHEDVLAPNSEHQDLLLKITVPSTERLAMLADLHETNINWFSLFQTEEALVRTLAYEKAERHEI